MRNVINNLKKSDTCKIQLTITINLSYTNQERLKHSKIDKIQIMINDKGDGVIEELFQSLLLRYYIGLETTVKGSSFIFDHICSFTNFRK